MPLDQTASGAHASSGTYNSCSPCQPHGSAGLKPRGPAGKAARTNTPASLKKEVGSNPTGVVRVQSGFVWKANTLQIWGRDDLDVFFFKNNRLNLLKKKASKSSRPLIFYPGLVRRHGTREAKGLFWELSPGPLAPKGRIMPLDQTASGAHASSGT